MPFRADDHGVPHPPEDRHPRRRRVLRLLVVVALGVAAISFVVGHGATLRWLVDGIGTIDPLIALIGLGCSGIAIVNRGMLNRAAHQAVGLDPGVGAMTQTAAVGFAAQKMVKSAGAVGLAVFVRHGKRRGHAAGEVAAACALTAAASFAALGVLLSTAIVVLAITGRLTGWWVAAAAGFAVYTLLVVVVTAVIARSRPAAEWLWRGGQRVRRRVRRRARPDRPDAPFPTDMFDAIATARRRPDAMRRMFVHAIASKALGAFMLTAAIAAVGLPISAHGALVIYATALAASMVTIIPGGFGTVEGSTAALLLAAGATAGSAGLAVALFRLFDLWLPVLTGAAVARGDISRARTQPDAPRPTPALTRPAVSLAPTVLASVPRSAAPVPA